MQRTRGMLTMRRWRRLALGLGLWLLLSVAQAQDTPPANPVVRLQAILNFPQQLWLEALVMAEPGTLTNITLAITPEERDPVIVQIPLSEVVYNNSQAAVAYSWAVPRNLPPPLFGEISYLWRFQRANGETFSAEGSIPFQDTRFRWQFSTHRVEPIRIVTTSPALQPTTLRDSVQRVYDLVRETTGANITFDLLVQLPDVPLFCPLNEAGEPVIGIIVNRERQPAPCDTALAERIYLLSGYTQVEAASRGDFQAQFMNILFDAFYGPAWQTVDVPAWFRRGLQQFYQTRPLSQALALSQRNARTSRPLSLATMQNLPDDAESRALWEAQAYGMVLYIADTIGVPELFEFALNPGSAGDFASTYAAVVGQPLDVLIPNWQSWIFSQRAAQAYTYNPHLPETSTPTPTDTDTPTPSITPTFTPTVFFTRTPVPTRTRIPPTPTITPRPPQSFVLRATPTNTLTPTVPPSPTPTLTQSLGISGINDAQFYVLLAGAGLLVLLLLIGVVIGVRRR